jgi:hypothetical protein
VFTAIVTATASHVQIKEKSLNTSSASARARRPAGSRR